MREQVRKLSVGQLVREFSQRSAAGTADAVGIWKVLPYHPLERVDQLFFRVHKGGFASPSPAESHDRIISVDGNSLRTFSVKKPVY